MNPRCDYCGCLLHYEIQKRRRGSDAWINGSIRCTPENQNSQLYKTISAQAFKDFWALGSTCLGCGKRRELKEEIPQDEATRFVAQHNAGLETAEAQYEIQHRLFSVPRTEHGVGLVAYLPWLPLRPHQTGDEIPVQAHIYALDLMEKLYSQKSGKLR